MKTATVRYWNLTGKITPIEKVKQSCLELHGWYPDTVRQVDSGDETVEAWTCYESAQDAELWDKQK